MPRLTNSSPVKAVTLIGTSCRGSARLVAVTTISASWPSMPFACACAVAIWLTPAAARSATTATHRLLLDFISYPPPLVPASSRSGVGGYFRKHVTSHYLVSILTHVRVRIRRHASIPFRPPRQFEAKNAVFDAAPQH